MIGYGVVDGEKETLQYVEFRGIKIQRGDYLFIFTDGFTLYFKLRGFEKLFFEWWVGLEKE